MVDILDSSGNPCKNDLSKREAWIIITQYWHSNIKENPKIEGLNSTTDRLTDVTHGLGATIIGSASALFLWLGIHPTIAQGSASLNLKKVLIVVGWVILIVLLGIAWRRANIALQSVVNLNPA